MHVVIDRIEIPGAGRIGLDGPSSRGGGPTGVAAGLAGVGSIADRLPAGEAEAIAWWVAEDSGRATAHRSASLVLRVVDVRGPLRMFRHGYQSWSPCDVAVFGVDHDPSLADGSLELVRGVHQADQRIVTHAEELRSEWVTLLVDADDEPILIGFDGGDRHDGTFRLRHGVDGPELWCEAFFGDAVMPADTRIMLHDLIVASGASADTLLGGWASVVGARGGARVDSPFQVGWCSWYHYFHDVTEADLDHNLAHSAEWPFEVFQLDDGYQSAIGDWLTTNERFPSDLAAIAERIRAQGVTAGLWIAPFLAAPDSRVALEHPDWLARFPDGSPLITMFNPPWGGGLDGFMYSLDPTNPAVIEHLETLARTLVAHGFDYLKLDFTFAPSYDGVWHDVTRTPAQRVRAGFDAIRRGAGDAFLLGCGVPLSNVVGVVDGNRIGPDVAPSWPVEATSSPLAGYEASRPSTRNAFLDTAARAFMHRRLWLNDPDCLMLRSTHTELTAAQAHTWVDAVGVSGGMAVVSDDLGLLDDGSRALLDRAITLGRATDDAARAGRTPAAAGLLDGGTSTSFQSVVGSLEVDLESGASEFRPID